MAYLSAKLNDKSADVMQLEASDTTGYSVDWHAHDCHMLLLPRQGGLLLSTESSRPTHIGAQAFSFVPVNFAHATQAVPGRETHLTLYVDPAYVRHQGLAHGYRGFARQLDRSGIWQASATLDSILRLHDQLLASASTAAFARQLPHLNHLLFEECARIIACQPARPQPSQAQQHARLVGDIQRYIREHLDADLSVEALGHEFHLSRRHLTRIFKAVTQQTVLDYTNRIRVETAARLIGSTSLSILQVGLAVGLDSPSYLARLCKRHLGLTPGELRARR